MSTTLKIAIGVLIALLFIKQCTDSNRVKKQYEQSFKVQSDSLNYFKSKNGELIASVSAHDITLENAKNLGLLKDLKIKKLKNLVNHTKVNTVIKDSFITSVDTLIINDTINHYTFNYADKWLKMDGTITNDVTINYEVFEEFEVTAIRKAPRFLAKKILVVDVLSKNPNSTVKNIESIQIKVPEKKWYETRGFAFGIGFIANSFLSSQP